MPVEWARAYETNESRVDDQHKRLFGYVNQLEGLILRAERGNLPSKTEIEDLMIFLDTYVNVHFAYEEMCFQIRKCPLAKANRDAHNGLLRYWGDFQEEAKLGVSFERLQTLHTTLVKWLTNHICSIDIDMRQAPKA